MVVLLLIYDSYDNIMPNHSLLPCHRTEEIFGQILPNFNYLLSKDHLISKMWRTLVSFIYWACRRELSLFCIRLSWNYIDSNWTLSFAFAVFSLISLIWSSREYLLHVQDHNKIGFSLMNDCESQRKIQPFFFEISAFWINQ